MEADVSISCKNQMLISIEKKKISVSISCVNTKQMRNFWVLLFCVRLVLLAFTASGYVVLIGKNVSLSFDDIEANFASSLKGSAKSGKLYVAEPLDACSVLVNEVDTRKNGSKSAYVLIIRGGCSFEDKVRRAQAAGFKAAIVYDNEYGDLVAMAGNRDGIKIAAVFVSKPSGETLAKYAGADAVDVWIVPGVENSAWSIMAISFISLLAMSAMLATCFFVRRHRVRRSIRSSRVQEFHGMSRRLVKAMPSLIFTEVVEDNTTSGTCAICLEDYNVGEKLRILPCRHKFHAMCVDFWLTSRRTFCPVCKRDARSSNGDHHPPVSESTPLLLASSTVASVSSSSSFTSSLATSPPILIINAASFRSNQQSIPLFNQSLHLNGSRSSVDLRNAASSSQRSRASYLTTSTNSLVYPPVISSLNSRHLCPYYIPQSSPGTTATSSYLGSSSQHHHPYPPLHYSESATSFSPFASAQSLPGC